MSLFQKLLLGKYSPFIIGTSAIIVWVLCLPLFQDGMFIDGIQYAAVARNLALGVGSFWNPVLAQNSVAGLNSFHEHPPLVFCIQSLFFKVFGFNNIYPERIYCLVTFLITAAFISLIWRKIFEGTELRKLWWLPVLLWIIMPIVFWAYTNDIQENTMGVFTTGAVYFFLCAVKSPLAWRAPHLYIGCISVLLAGLSKGVPGLFPLAFFAIYWLSVRKMKLSNAVLYSVGMVTFLAVALFIILQNEIAKEALRTWFFDRMLKRISSDPVEQSHFHILIGLFTEQLPAIITVVVALLFFRWKKIKNGFDSGQVFLFSLSGFAASLPLMLTLVQRNFYFTPALPMFAITWALLMADGSNHVIGLLENLKGWRKTASIVTTLALCAGITATTYYAGKIKRDKTMLRDVYTIKTIVPDRSFVSVSSDIMWMNWSFRCYMMRYNSISFSTTDTCAYYIAYPADKVSSRYEPLNTSLSLFKVYKAK